MEERGPWEIMIVNTIWASFSVLCKHVYNQGATMIFSYFIIREAEALRKK